MSERLNNLTHPLVSVIVASYNHAQFVERAVESVLNQGWRQIEVIVVDDGSDDGTPEILEATRYKNVSIVRLEENRIAHPRNVALGLSHGDYIAFQNSDDEWAAGKLTTQIEFMEAHAGTVACFTSVEIIDENNEPLSGTWADHLFTNENRPRSIWQRFLFDFGNCLCLPSAVVRRSAFDEVGFFRPSLVQLSDLDLWVRLAAVGEFHIVDEPLTRMRIIPEVNFSQPSTAVKRRTAIELAEVLGRYAESPLLEQLPCAFYDVMPEQAQTVPARLAALALHAWGNSDSHKLFADRLLAGLIDDPIDREEIMQAFGADIVRDFINRRGMLTFDWA